MRKIFWIFIFMFLAVHVLPASGPRIKYSINENWLFLKADNVNAFKTDFNDSDWLRVNFPHTWNADDTKDEKTGYYRGTGWYRRQIIIPEDKSNQQVTVYFEGANQELELYVNGKSAGIHRGGYTRFSFDITGLVKFGEHNLFAIRLDNSHNENIPPLSADFTFFGGVYRDVYLIFTNKTSISTSFYASDGVFLKTKMLKKNETKVEIKTLLTNAGSSLANVKVEHTLLNPEKQTVLKVSKSVRLNSKVLNNPDIQFIKIANPRLWSPETPSLYSVITRIYDLKTNELLDEMLQPLGIRWFEFKADNGCILNGKPIKLIGTNRHQCFEGLGNALDDEFHVRDIRLLKEMGGNFLRISHYPQDPVIMEMCDKLGIITSVEIPVVDAISDNEGFTQNCLNMAREMVYQDFNRPSVFIWAYMNEVLLRLPFKEDSVKNVQYFKSVHHLAQEIDSQLRNDDPGRYTMIPMHGNFNDYMESGLTLIPDIVGWNLYQGWYGGTFDKFEIFIDEAQKKLKKPFIVSEYGADVDPRLHSFDPQRFDYTQEYANLYHEHYIKAIRERNFIAGAAIWNLNDFYSEERGNAVPHVNSKGITTLSREPKDTYLQYQAILCDKPVVNIGGRLWKIRGGNADANNTCIQSVKAYSNLKSIEMYLNGKSIGIKPVQNYFAIFDIPFVNGENVIEAVAKSDTNVVRDMQKIDFRLIPQDLKDKKQIFTELNVMLGSKRYFTDNSKSMIWIPEKQYQPGNWGYIGGTNYTKNTRHGQQPASDSDIMGTNEDPVFQTKRIGLKEFKADVPDGEYTVSLYFAELQSGSNNKMSIYNLGDEAKDNKITDRIFNVTINETEFLKNLNISSEFGNNTSVVKKMNVMVKNGSGISVKFDAVNGEPFLNAIRIYRQY